MLDLMLPLLSGEQVMEAFRQKEMVAGVPIIIISGKTEVEIKKAAKSLGAVSWLRKPFDNKEVVELVKKYLTQSIKKEAVLAG